MKNARLLIIATAAFLSLSCTQKASVVVTKADTASDFFSHADWQLDATFPDWLEKPNANFAVNHIAGFRTYHGQGTVYVTPSENCSRFSLYVNNSKIATDTMHAGGTYAVDISTLALDGVNSIHVSAVEPPDAASVRVRIAYPTVLLGSLKDAGISEEATALIEKLAEADVAHGFSSAQLAVIKDGRLVYRNAWGTVQTYDSDGSRVQSAPVTNDTLYDLASNTKMYSVNYALQYLVSQKKLSLDTKLVDVLGAEFASATVSANYSASIPLAKNKAWKAALTVRHLLRHQAGFPASVLYFSDKADTSAERALARNENPFYAGADCSEETRNATFRQLCRTPLRYEPGTEFLYSDIDYMLLGFVIERITEKRLDEFLRETFFEPLGLKHITYNPLQNGFSAADCAATELAGNTRAGAISYSGVRTAVIQGEVHDENAYYAMAGVSGHAGLFASATDVAVLASVMLTGGYGGHRFFSRDVIDAFTAPLSEQVADYGLGWWRQGDYENPRYFTTISDSSVIGHQGFTGTMTVIAPDENLVVVCLSNKIHSPLIAGGEKQSQFYGNYYTTASLGFTTQLLRLSTMHAPSAPLERAELHSVFKSLLFDMVQDARRKVQIEAAISIPSAPIADAAEESAQGASLLPAADEDPRYTAYRALKSVYDAY